jgi:hypothetical protein
MMHDWQYGPHFPWGGFPALLLSVAAMVLIYGIPAMRVVRRVGFSSWWGLLAAVPLINIIALWVFAFRDWPIEKER